jgi:dTDP-4-dehydrorhamnose reductase
MSLPLLLGSEGQVGGELRRMGGFAVLPRAEADMRDTPAVRRAVLSRRPSVVVNCAAYTAVDRAESEPELALAVNRDGPAALADACAELDIPLIHLSTDYVFDGARPDAYGEDDATRPLSVYGASKLAGEHEVRARLARHVVLRTAWVFSPRRDNFVRSMLKLAGRPELSVVDDQRGCPTAAVEVARAVRSMVAAMAVGHGRWGTFHFCGWPAVSRFAFAEAIFAARGGGPRLRPITTEAYPLPARRPANSALDCGKVLAAYGIAQPDWRTSLKAIIGDPS